MTPPPQVSSAARAAAAVSAPKTPQVKVEAPIAAVAAPTVYKREPPAPQWRPDDSAASSYDQARHPGRAAYLLCCDLTQRTTFMPARPRPPDVSSIDDIDLFEPV